MYLKGGAIIYLCIYCNATNQLDILIKILIMRNKKYNQFSLTDILKK